MAPMNCFIEFFLMGLVLQPKFARRWGSVYTHRGFSILRVTDKRPPVHLIRYHRKWRGQSLGAEWIRAAPRSAALVQARVVQSSDESTSATGKIRHGWRCDGDDVRRLWRSRR